MQGLTKLVTLFVFVQAEYITEDSVQEDPLFCRSLIGRRTST